MPASASPDWATEPDTVIHLGIEQHLSHPVRCLFYSVDLDNDLFLGGSFRYHFLNPCHLSRKSGAAG